MLKEKKNSKMYSVHLFLLLWTHEYLLYSLDSNLELSLFIFLAQIIRTLSGWLPCPFTSILLSFDCFLTFWYYKVPSFAFALSQHWNQSFVQGALVPFVKAWCLETKTWFLDVLITTGVSLLLGFLSGS